MTTPLSRAAQTDAENRLTRLGETIVRYLLGTEPRMVTRLDISELVVRPYFWDNISRNTGFVLGLSTIINRYDPEITAWADLPAGVKMWVLGDRMGGEVIAVGIKGNAERTNYLVITHDRLYYHSSLSQAKIDAISEAARKDEAAVLRAMNGELELFSFLTSYVRATCELKPQDERMLAEIRQTLWELTAYHWSPTEQCARISLIQSLLATIAKNSGYELEDFLGDGRRTLNPNS